MNFFIAKGCNGVVQLLVERVDVSTKGSDIRLRTEGLTKLVADLRAIRPEPRRAA